MKKGLYILAALTALVACSKEFDNQNQVKPEDSAKNESNVHELFATLPELYDAETKAVIDDEDGSFAWEAYDAIAVVTGEGNVYKYETIGSGSAARFTYTGDIIGTPKTIYFPWVEGYSAADYVSMSVPTSINGLTGALSGDAIRLTGTITQSEGKYVSQLSYRNAFLRVTVKNVPAFAKSLGFDIGKDWEDETTIEFTLSDKQDIVAYFPVVTNEDIQFAVSLFDNSGNYIYRKETSSAKSFTDGSLLTMKPMEVGPILTFDNQSGWTPGTLYVGGQEWEENITSFNASNNYPYKMLTRDDDVLYVVLPADIRKDIALSFIMLDGENEKTTGTQCVYLYRDIDFEIPEGGGMRTDYRIYPHSSVYTSINMYVTKPLHIYVENSANWGTYEVHCYGHKASVANSDSGWMNQWTGNFAWDSSSYTVGGYTANMHKFDINAELCGTEVSTGGLEIGYFGNSDNWKIDSPQFIGDYVIVFNGSSTTTPTISFDNRLSAAWPGTSFTGISNEINSAKYYSFSNTYYGSDVWVVFSDNGSSPSVTWEIPIDRDYDYGYNFSQE